jgi:hypothetical protein
MHSRWFLCLPVLAALLGLGSGSCSVGDAVCPDNTVEENRDDDCPFGPPGGPQRKNATKCVVVLDDAGCTKTFRDDVFPILTGAVAGRSGGGCSQPNCHGPNTQGGAILPISAAPTPDELYATLAAFRNDAGDPYIEEGNANAWFLCNLTGRVGGGNPMPPTAGLTDAPNSTEDDQDLATVEEWVRCGMKLDGIGTGGGAGVGGGVGVGGAGGGGGAGGN